jgi:transcriptional regulator with XRE-family HTH domain
MWKDDGAILTPGRASMHVDSARLRELRAARQWSQEQLAQLSGLNLRTIQRLESGAKISMESLRALAAVFEVPAESLLATRPAPSEAARAAIRDGALRGLEFSGTTARAEFWWFALAVLMLLALARLLGPLPLQIACLLLLLPWIAACTRRLRDAGLSPWWQLISVVPVAGMLVLLYLLTFPPKVVVPVAATEGSG